MRSNKGKESETTSRPLTCLEAPSHHLAGFSSQHFIRLFYLNCSVLSCEAFTLKPPRSEFLDQKCPGGVDFLKFVELSGTHGEMNLKETMRHTYIYTLDRNTSVRGSKPACESA